MPGRAFVLVDTSVWISYFGGKSDRAGESLEALLSDRRAAIAPAVRFEFLPHVRSASDRRRMEAFFSGLPLLEEAPGYWARCEADQRRLLDAGVHGIGYLDLLLSDIARTHAASIFSLDRHFDRICRVLGIARFEG